MVPVAASHARSLHPFPLSLKGHQAKREGEKHSQQVRLVSGHLLLQREGALGTAGLRRGDFIWGCLWVRSEDE